MHERAGGTSGYPWELQERKRDPRDQYLGPTSSPLLCLLYKVLVLERDLPATKTGSMSAAGETRLPYSMAGQAVESQKGRREEKLAE